MKNTVFFDIDGTIWDRKCVITDSTRNAIKQLRKNGNLAYLCSGRSRAAIRSEDLFSIGFDGIVAGCGTYIEYRDEVLYDKKMTLPEILRVASEATECGFPVLFEGEDSLFADPALFGKDEYTAYLKNKLGGNVRPLDELTPGSPVNKFTVSCKSAKTQIEVNDYLESMELRYEILDHKGNVYEMVPKGFSKATGIKHLCDMLGISLENTYSFGDSANDLEMLQFTAHSVAMGNASDDVKAKAEFVTSTVTEDGIERGLKYFGLI